MDKLARIEPLLEGLSEERVRQLLDFARFLAMEDERLAWQRLGEEQLARAYGDDEPEYAEADIRGRWHC